MGIALRRSIILLLAGSLSFYLIYLYGGITPRTQTGSDPTQTLGYKSEALLAANRKILNKPLDQEGGGGDSARKNLYQILKLAPTSDEALMQAALISYIKSEAVSSPDILENIKQRNPRNRKAIKMLVGYYARIGNFEELVKNIDLLYRLESDDFSKYLDILSEIYSYETGRKEIFKYISKNATWSSKFFSRQINNYQQSQQEDSTALEEFALSFSKANKDNKYLFNFLHNYINVLIVKKQFSTAYRFWASLRNLAGQENELLYNPLLIAGDLPLQFNWSPIYAKECGAEYDGVQGVFVFFNSTSQCLIMQQYFKRLNSDSYELNVKTSGRISKDSVKLLFEFKCAADNSVWHSTALTAQSLNEGGISESILPPSSECSHGVLRLWALPHKKYERSSFRFEAISLTAKGQSHH